MASEYETIRVDMTNYWICYVSYYRKTACI